MGLSNNKIQYSLYDMLICCYLSFHGHRIASFCAVTFTKVIHEPPGSHTVLIHKALEQ